MQNKLKIFWGCGKIGRNALAFFRENGSDIDFFCDSNLELFGSEIMGVRIISPQELKSYRDSSDIYITCAKQKEVWDVLHVMKFDAKHIHSFTSLNDWVLFAICNSGKLGEYRRDKKVEQYLFELSNGLALGGIEAWCIKEAERLKRKKCNVSILLEENKNDVMKVDREILLTYPSLKEFSDYQRLNYIKEKIISKHITVFISNSACDNFIAACLAKQENNNFKIISVIHNDEIGYFNTYIKFEKYIDKLLVISNKIRNEMISRGFPREKMMNLPWQMSVQDGLCREYCKNGYLHIGYAGRITKWQKRVDLLIDVIKSIAKRNSDFVIEIAGDGDYLDELKCKIEKASLNDKVIIRGFISREQIPEFWSRQDIMISCSDYEGHSITQCEAMAAGAVPILTDVSGARDDVEDGVNGYIVEIGAVDQIVDRICYLYDHRELLPIMGKRAYETIKEKYSEEKVEALWGEILEFDR